MHEYENEDEDLEGCSCGVSYGCIMMIVLIALTLSYCVGGR